MCPEKGFRFLAEKVGCPLFLGQSLHFESAPQVCASLRALGSSTCPAVLRRDTAQRHTPLALLDKALPSPSTQVVHHPTVIAAVAEGRRWRFEGDADVKSKFWGRSIELRPEGEVTGCVACEEFRQVPGLLLPGAPMRHRSWLVAGALTLCTGDVATCPACRPAACDLQRRRCVPVEQGGRGRT